MRLRYTGATPMTFIELGVSVDPGDTFIINGDASRYVSRDDVVVVIEKQGSTSDDVSNTLSGTPSRVSRQAVPADESVTGDQDPGTDTKAE